MVPPSALGLVWSKGPGTLVVTMTPRAATFTPRTALLSHQTSVLAPRLSHFDQRPWGVSLKAAARVCAWLCSSQLAPTLQSDEEGTRGRFSRSAGCTLAVQPREFSQHCLLVPSSLRFESWLFFFN